MSRTIRGPLALISAACVFGAAQGYGIYLQTTGREDFAKRYDKVGWAYPKQVGVLNYDFGKIGKFNALPPGVTDDIAKNSVINAASKWSNWANIKYDTTNLGDVNTGLVRLRYDDTKTGAYVEAFETVANSKIVKYAEMVFGKTASGGTAWNETNFKWTVLHEWGHTLGLVDLYENMAEDFVDHAAGETDNPNLSNASTKDNVMHRYNNTNDYSKDPTTDIDNDEILGVKWLWGSISNQICTGDLLDYSAGNYGRRGSAKHHGTQNGGWWTYRGTFGPKGDDKPFIDIDFAGYDGFEGTLLGDDASEFEYVGNQGGFKERFRVKKAGWNGNFILKLKSKFDKERKVKAWITGGGRTDNFILDANQDGLAFSSFNNWPVVFGPVPEPGSFLVLGGGIAAVLLRRRKK